MAFVMPAFGASGGEKKKCNRRGMKRRLCDRPGVQKTAGGWWGAGKGREQKVNGSKVNSQQ